MNRFPCVIMRGGTSKAVCFKREDMPSDESKWTEFLLDVMGSPDAKQIDGLGGANSLTSKVAIISCSNEPGVDLDYTFAQVSLTQEVVDMKGNCGNISSVAAPFAIEQGLVKVDPNASRISLVIKNTNTDKLIEAEVEVSNGLYVPEGDTVIPGVPGSGSNIGLIFHGSEGALTGKLLPTGQTVNRVLTSKGEVVISIVDSANPLVFILAEDVGLIGTELASDFDQATLDYIEEIRSIAASLCGFASEKEATLKSPAVPKATIISKAQAYKDVKGKDHDLTDMDISVRMMSMQKPHQALAITGAVCISAASKIKGTLVEQMVTGGGESLRIAHPGGVMETHIQMENDDVKSVQVLRTARRIMQGDVFTHKNY